MKQKYFKNKNKKGFVVLFAVTLAAILLSIALGIATVAEKEVKFGTSAKDANDAFVAADTGVECALFYDRTSAGENAFTGSSSMSCNGSAVTIAETPAYFWTFSLYGLGSAATSCARVTVDKTNPPETHIISKGYNMESGAGACNPGNPSRTERQLEVTYITQSP